MKILSWGAPSPHIELLSRLHMVKVRGFNSLQSNMGTFLFYIRWTVRNVSQFTWTYICWTGQCMWATWQLGVGSAKCEEVAVPIWRPPVLDPLLFPLRLPDLALERARSFLSLSVNLKENYVYWHKWLKSEELALLLRIYYSAPWWKELLSELLDNEYFTDHLMSWWEMILIGC